MTMEDIITILANTFHVKKFHCFFGLRPGIIFLLYFFKLANFFIFLILLNPLIRHPSDSDPWMLLIIGANLTSVILLIYDVSLYFPEMNKIYEKNSVNAKYAKYFFFYNCVGAIFSSMVAIIFSFLTLFIGKRSLALCQVILLYSTLCTVAFVHFMGVTYSFFLSILKQDDILQGYKELRTVVVVPNTPQPRPKPVDGESSSNGNGIGSNGNVYVELPLVPL